MNECKPPVRVTAIEGYRLWAPGYDSTPNPLLALEQRHLAPLLRLAEDRDVLDMGCGTGRWIAQLEAIGARSIVGIDQSRAMLDQAEMKLRTSAWLVQADCCQTPLPRECCDWIVASFLVSYVADLGRLAAEAARLCRHDGRIVITDVHPATRRYGWRRTFRCGQQTIEITTYPYEVSDLVSAMERAGFAPVAVRDLGFDEPEQAIFARAGRPELYSDAFGLPALLMATFRRKSE